MKNTAPKRKAAEGGSATPSASTPGSGSAPATAAKKRKSFDSSGPASSSTAATSASANKKAKTGEREKPLPGSSTSVLLASSAQTDFPRGGGSVLTPLEHRQAIREARAEADALFKDSTTPAKSKSGKTSSGGDALSDAERNKAGLAKQKYNRDKRNALKKKHALPGDATAQGQPSSEKKDFVRIEHLNYKRLQTGARLLCTILAIHPYALVLSLPGQLLGHVPITAISPTFTDRLQSLADAYEEDDENDSEEDDEDSDDNSDEENDDQPKKRGSKRSSDAPELRDLYTVGQWVQATVTNVLSGGAYKAAISNSDGQRSREGGEYERESRRVELSLDPSLFNQGVLVEELGQGYVLPAVVKSVEDHGYILDFGLEVPLAGFCPFKNSPSGKKDVKLHVGQVIPASVISVTDNKRSATVILRSKEVTSAFLGSKSTPPSLSGLIPGLVVDALITANLPAGLNVKLFGLFDATIERSHLPALREGQTYESYFKEGKKIRARVFWELGDLYAEQLALGERDDAGSGARQYRKITLSAADQVLALEPPVVSVVGGIDPSVPRKALSEAFPIGTKLRVTVTRVDADWGLFCTLASNESQRLLMGSDAASIQGFVHISSVSDSHIDTLSLVDSAPYHVGTTHEVRVISHAPTDRLLLLSMKPSVLALKFMRVSEVVVGEELRGSITKVDENKIVVDIGGAHNGIVFPSHFSDILLKSKKALAKYKPGLSVKVRVWAVNPAKNRIVLTLKKTLLQSDLPVVGSLQDARVGVVTHAVVSRLPDPSSKRGGGAGLLVDLYGGLRAFIPASETSESTTPAELPSAADLNTRFYDGKVVKVRLTSVDYDTGRLMASIRQALPAFQERLNVSRYTVGQKVDGVVAAVHEDVVVLNVAPTQARGLIALSLLARMREMDVETLRAKLSEGDKIEGLQVWSKSEEKGLLHLNDARAAAEARNGVNGGGKNANRAGADEATFQALVVGKKKYSTLVKTQGFRGDHNAVHIIMLNVDNGKGGMTTVQSRLHVTDCYDSYDDAASSTTTCVQGVQRGEGSRAALNLPAENSTLECVVVDVGTPNAREVHLSARPSILGAAASPVRDPVINEVSDLHIGSKYRGFVRAIGDGGLTVDLGRSVQARVKVRQAVDVLSSSWKDQFEIGKVVEGRITSISKTGKKSLVDMSLRSPKEELAKERQAKKDKSKDAKGKSSKLAFQHGLEQFEKGQKVKCSVKSIKEEIGLFLQIQTAGTNVSGLCHKSEVADNGSPEAVKAYSVGDHVKAIILKINKEDKKISFGLKPSYFEDADFLDSDDEEEDVTMEGDEDEDDDEEEEDDDEDDDEDEDAMDDDEDEDEDLSLAQGAHELDGSDSEDEDEEMEDADDDDDNNDGDGDEALDMKIVPTTNGGSAAEVAKSKKKVAPLQVAGGFSWSGVGQDDEGDAADFDSDSSSEADETEVKSKRVKGKDKAQKNASVDLDEKLPESVSDFERLLLGSPNNSFLWIQFMSFQLQLSDIEAARQVAQRALKVINYREEQEKLNVWIALLNLEDRYGSEDALDNTFKEAVQANDAETVYMRMLTILEKSNKLAKAETIWQRAVKKFNTSIPVWTGFGKFYLRHGRVDDVRALMARAQQSLPKPRHVELVKSFALAEFSTGEPERGRTLFERLVDSHPKKLDIWWLYIDQEAKAGNVPAARSIFERVLVLPQSLKKAKAVLKKWHAFEQKHGGPKDVQRVVKRAQQFVEATMEKREGAAGRTTAQSSGEADEGDEDDDFAGGDDDEEEEGDD
ncbi:hypothetical protein CF327_g6323 [Tilletia walkeri]|nr:hypothetical protein CF327_g6323 [Tilletia walkeri]